MFHHFRRVLLVAVVLVGTGLPAQAATVTIKAGDGSGNALDSVVVSLVPVARAALPAARPAQIEQRNKTFLPAISVVQTGTAIEFPNNDTVRHHVYSFSAAKVFELKLYAGKPEKPVVFDKQGVVVLGCNIHDKMAAYVVVVDTPWSAISQTDGVARIADVPTGDYQLQLWHPRRLGMPEIPPRPLRIAGDQTETVKVELRP
ncbi:methylamine utilization protein [Methyloversatilis discipulorum]|uniref:methylamine utilization protein n=1 Tax=Methyloversatilis discipulorum TaxID=1119528 RepID=UPI0038CBFDAD